VVGGVVVAGVGCSGGGSGNAWPRAGTRTNNTTKPLIAKMRNNITASVVLKRILESQMGQVSVPETQKGLTQWILTRVNYELNPNKPANPKQTNSIIITLVCAMIFQHILKGTDL
jgi:hypothetical protein